MENIIPIENIKTFKGTIPKGYLLCVHEKGDPYGRKVFYLNGFDEIGLFDSELENPEYSFISEGTFK